MNALVLVFFAAVVVGDLKFDQLFLKRAHELTRIVNDSNAGWIVWMNCNEFDFQ